MADIQVQTRLRICCREVLGKLDKARSHLLTQPAELLREQVGELPLEPATERARTCSTPDDPKAARVAEVCTKLCREHGDTHAQADERGEESLWRTLEQALG